MSLYIHTSNRMEHLADALAGILRVPLPAPFEPEVIVVQSKGMQRWLAMELARRFGVWANCVYPFPNAMIWRLFRAVMPEVPENSAFSAEVMTWKIMALLPGFLEQEQFAPLRRYLEHDPDGLKLLQLAQRIADTFDQYTLFRPEMLLEWEKGGEGEWQAPLWREIAGQGEGRHPGAAAGRISGQGHLHPGAGSASRADCSVRHFLSPPLSYGSVCRHGPGD